MFEKFFVPPSEEQNEEYIERSLLKIVGQQFKAGVNGPAMYMALKAIQRENEEKGYKLHDHYLLNVVKRSALGHASEVEDFLMGGPSQVTQNINNEIDRLRRDLSEKEE